MDGALPILIVFVLPIVILGMVFGHRQKMIEAKVKMNAGSDEVTALAAELKSVKERLNTLEAIVTDDKYQLNQEFSKLKTTSS
ncbi:hypothetical protein [Aliiglaciecola lipolytica]|uniref:Phage shock protein B n=1 Tax=Aliiglaciecola lipolytica E3 TaxID=1127673 RepID=K6YDX7_9ALTE|nr:hypothetical protein [Aliiglaciecola lipolytica]GAC16357.1 hypothetical protein GLIP_3746 [Aliiglaciecola lipolytica E3]